MSRSKAGRARRDALVGAAQRAMLEHGADAKLRHVAEAAGLTSGAVLYHFPDVQALLLEANRAGMERFYDERIAALATIDDPVEKLVVTVRTGLPVDRQDASVRLLCELGGAAGRQPVYAALLTALYDRQVAMYQVILESGTARGVFDARPRLPDRLPQPGRPRGRLRLPDHRRPPQHRPRHGSRADPRLRPRRHRPPARPHGRNARMTDQQTPSLTVLFMPESAYGPTNQCIGLGKVLLERGHTVVFAAERSWEGKLAPLGFVEALVDLAEPDPDAPEDAAGQFWIDFINETAPEFRKPTVEQLTSFVQPTYQALIDGAKYCEPQLRSIIAEHRPDVLVEDNVVTFPALLTSGAPFVRIVSCNPLEVRGDDIAPVFSGYAADDRTGWDDFLAEFDRTHQETWDAFDAWVQEQGARAAVSPRLHPHLERRQPLRLPRGARLRRRPAARQHLAPARLQRPRDRRGVRAARLVPGAAAGLVADLPVPRLARWGRHRPAPAADRRARAPPPTRSW